MDFQNFSQTRARAPKWPVAASLLAVLGLGACATGNLSSGQPDANAGQNLRFAANSPLREAMAASKALPPIIFVHGNGDNASIWQTTLWRFESNGWPKVKNRRVVRAPPIKCAI
jgi:pimeloyl-ACP methyl ester carboxylesterase